MAPARTHESAHPALKQIDLAGTVRVRTDLQKLDQPINGGSR